MICSLHRHLWSSWLRSTLLSCFNSVLTVLARRITASEFLEVLNWGWLVLLRVPTETFIFNFDWLLRLFHLNNGMLRQGELVFEGETFSIRWKFVYFLQYLRFFQFSCWHRWAWIHEGNTRSILSLRFSLFKGFILHFHIFMQAATWNFHSIKVKSKF